MLCLKLINDFTIFVRYYYEVMWFVIGPDPKFCTKTVIWWCAKNKSHKIMLLDGISLPLCLPHLKIATIFVQLILSIWRANWRKKDSNIKKSSNNKNNRSGQSGCHSKHHHQKFLFSEIVLKTQTIVFLRFYWKIDSNWIILITRRLLWKAKSNNNKPQHLWSSSRLNDVCFARFQELEFDE